MQGKREKRRIWRNNGISRMEEIPRSPRATGNRGNAQENIQSAEVEEDDSCRLLQGNSDEDQHSNRHVDQHEMVDDVHRLFPSQTVQQAADRPASTSKVPRDCEEENNNVNSMKAASLPPSTPQHQVHQPIIIEKVKEALSQRFKSARKAFAFFDLKGAGKVSPKDFKSALDELGIKALGKSAGHSLKQPWGTDKNPLSNSSKARMKTKQSSRSLGRSVHDQGSEGGKTLEGDNGLQYDANQVLKLRGTSVGSKEAREIVLQLQNNKLLSVLDMSDSSISVAAASIITKALVADPSLSERVSSIVMSRSPAGDQVAEKMWSCLANTKVVALDMQVVSTAELSLCPSSSRLLTGASLAKVLKESASLSHLHLGGNSLLSTGVEALARSLPHAASLECLHLEGNGIDDNGARALAEVLGTTRISHLFLASNEISSIGATILVEAIKKRESAPQVNHSASTADIKN
ncbi:hypothetical protein GUITHDRAFT_163294 [Guillardia theta CCMP2712]|uniref:EF-hand domain-containing protein n=1 Tax=Guillardia theta (strain CCMP2712) TaxID=905079 RepID=L1JBI1_GUITC|nr:hypothetical protein GUITHDRAFT_163294 [Guillardia theta CCMP2712]EKX45479.1 hypothetical protein GUITHDRAFT_163294 [Guillardia theta CCMP2712]|eukprot:XP_005832459.1 hypothetical protein GUITHDRAFT_163294 [Guillardia theta CCMP2712]